jgi:hypothetical protein
MSVFSIIGRAYEQDKLLIMSHLGQHFLRLKTVRFGDIGRFKPEVDAHKTICL